LKFVASVGIKNVKSTSRSFAFAVTFAPFAIAAAAVFLQLLPGTVQLGEDVGIILGLLLAFSLTGITLFRRLQVGRLSSGWLLLMLGSYLWVAAEFFDLDDLQNIRIMSDDIVPLGIWLLMAATILPALLRNNLKVYTKLMLAVGLMLQSISLVANLGDGSAFNMPYTSVSSMLMVNESFEVLSLAAYMTSLLIILGAIAVESPGSSPNVLWELINTTPGRAIGIMGEDVSWLWWRAFNPRAPFAKYYADSIVRKLDRGRPHKTLGRFAFNRSSVLFSQGDRRRQFAGEGRDKYEFLAKYAISPNAMIVDYGCGSLRIGQHFIRSQAPHRFWGLDVTDRFYTDGLALLERDLVETKQPQLRPIAEESLSEIRAALPDLIYSVAVMKHVPRSELETFWKNILGLLQPGATAVVFADVANVEMRTAAKNWAYPQDIILALIQRIAPLATTEVEIFSTPLYFGGKRFDPARFIVTV
jgi:hypothetical protein